MDRTSILGDTIDYMKELLEKIHKLKMNDTQASSDQIKSLGNLEELNKNTEATTKNSSRVRVCTYIYKILLKIIKIHDIFYSTYRFYNVVARSLMLKGRRKVQRSTSRVQGSQEWCYQH